MEQQSKKESGAAPTQSPALPTGPENPAEMKKGLWNWLSFSCGAASVFIVFRAFFLSHFNLVLSDRGDGRFSIAILEHWTRVFRGQSHMTSPNFFFPETDILGYSDAHFLQAIPYAIGRLLGLDRYVAFEIDMMLMAAIGFASMLYLLRRVLRLEASTALIGASLFAISNLNYIHIVHAHLAAAAFLPLLYVLAAEYWRLRNSRPTVARVCICMAGILLALLLFTSFYMGWFAALFGAIALILFIAFGVLAEHSAGPLRQVPEFLWSERWNLALGTVSFVAALVPFLIVYFPARARLGGRDLSEVLYYMNSPLGVFDVGRDNLLWGTVSRQIEHVMSPGGIHEHPAGWPFLTLTLFALSSLYCIRHLRRAAGEDPLQTRRFRLVCSLSLASFILWLASVNFWGHAPLWVVIQKLVPGGSAIRVPLRVDLVLNVGVVIVAMFGFDKLMRAMMAANSARAGAVGALLAAVLIGEQLNSMPTHLIDRSVESQSFSRIPAPPKGCTSFFISDESTVLYGMLTTQTDAMLVAEQLGIPTMNGYSSWSPTAWDLMTPGANVADGVADWAERHGVVKGICALDFSWGQWSPVDTSRLRTLPPTSDLMDKAIANGDFEKDNLTPWAAYQDVHGEMNTGHVHGGAHSLAETAGVGSLYQDAVGLNPGLTYCVTTWVSSSPGATATAQIATYDPGSVVATFSRALVPGPGWHLLRHCMAVSSAGTFRIHLLRNRGRGTVYWDDIRIYSDQPLQCGTGRGGCLANAGFEDATPSPWLPVQELRGGVTAAQAHSGRQSLAETAGAGSAYQDVRDLEPGRTYTISAWAYASFGATATAQMAVWDPGANLSTFSEAFSPHQGWERIERSFVVSSKGTLRIHLFRNQGTGTIYWDDVEVTPQQRPSAH